MNQMQITPQQLDSLTPGIRFSQTQIDTDQGPASQYLYIKLFIKFGVLSLVVIGIVWAVVLSAKSSSIQLQNQSESYDLIKLNSTSALCLDGTPGAYYLSKYGDPSRIYMHFLSGGWCLGQTYDQTLEDCYQRSKTKFGSSNSSFYSQKIYKNQGIFSLDPNNYFKDWKKVIFVYCDGSGRQGTRKQPINYKDTILYFRGHNITIETFDDLQKRLGLFSQSKQVIVGGGSAGGLSALIWGNYVKSKVQHGQVRVISDIGIFYNANHLGTQISTYKNQLSILLKISNQQIDHPISQCLQQFPNSKENCMFAQYIYKYIKPPIFFSQPFYDIYGMSIILGTTCNASFYPTNLDTCNSSQRIAIQDYRNNLRKLLKQIASDKKNSVFGINCILHQSLISSECYSQNYVLQQNTKYHINEVLKSWMENSTQNNIYLDSDPWSASKQCFVIT